MKYELQLIRLLANINISDENLNKINELFDKDINWSIFVDECFKNKISNLIIYNLKTYNYVEKIPYYIFKIFNGYWDHSVLKLSRYYTAIESILSDINKLQIPYAVLKGYDIINKIYASKSLYMREFNDLDILVDKSNLEPIIKILQDQSFIYGDYNFANDELKSATRYDIIRMKMDSHQLYTFVKKVNYNENPKIFGPLFIDINFSVFEGGKMPDLIDTNTLLENGVVMNSFNDFKYLSLDIYYTLIQLVLHLYREARTQELKMHNIDFTLHKFCDINEYIKKYSNYWDITKLRNMIKEYKLEEAFLFVLHFTDMLFETNYINSVLDNYCAKKITYDVYDNYFKHKYSLFDQNVH